VGSYTGDVFNDGYIFVRTPAFFTGKRYCIDGAALKFKPCDGSAVVRGDNASVKFNSVRVPTVCIISGINSLLDKKAECHTLKKNPSNQVLFTR